MCNDLADPYVQRELSRSICSANSAPQPQRPRIAIRSEFEIQQHAVWRLTPSTRREHALAGRLHLSYIENLIQRQGEHEVLSSVYAWEPWPTPSVMESGVSARLCLYAAKYFQSARQFAITRRSLEQCLTLGCNISRSLIISRLADILCELQDYAGAESKIQSGMCNMEKHGKRGRLWRRLQLASVEVALGKGALEDAEKQLQLIGIAPPVQDITDELLHVRSIMANARIQHCRGHYSEALQRWEHALDATRQLPSFRKGTGFTTAIIHLSVAHAQVSLENDLAGQKSYEAAWSPRYGC
ncbi:hypothetical protein M406DRAFT_75460 [Cryphonectria parasitica EP155]|uniref:Uncharacterized protein n=1 Tax=Cryphonectria parasitica (strain ATCC 38755 / EP155) TaxID=660469 RepID=A0A9P5CN57_CRYP1|nr:uncharacterized protein M406DRAFT_75460 [Cryphonectria parasitica EP155]KAF3763565.1 hypothetical protein M406DRAFT_75460 [Cryphonectria parasitica EP155]